MRRRRINSAILFCGFILSLLSFNSYASEIDKGKRLEHQLTIYFELDSAVINPSFMENEQRFKEFSKMLKDVDADTLTTVTKIKVASYASPEGGHSYNQKLSERRTEAIYNYLVDKLGAPKDLIEKSGHGAAWDQLKEMVLASDMSESDKKGIINIIDNVPLETWKRVNPNDRWLTLVDSRRKHLMDFNLGNPYRYMDKHFFPVLRYSSAVTIYYTRELPPEPEPITEPEPEPEPIPEPEPEPAPEYIDKPLFAVKTNLLFDAITALNIELELPIGNRWSIAGEWIFPWWTSCGNKSNSWQSGSSSSRNTFELLHGNIEGKYWFGDRSTKPVMTGWNLGLYVGGGKYDLEYKAEGYQGEFFIAAGLSGGYAHTINKKGNLRMEYTLGIGLMQTDYRYYEEHWGIDDTWHTIRQYDGRYTWVGPTRARVSLVWLLNKKIEKK